MHKEVLGSIDGVSLFPIVAIILFMFIFGLIIWYVVRMDKKQIGEMASMPLQEDNPLYSQTLSFNGKSKN